MTCKHSNSGCNYPQGDCSGACQSNKPKAKAAAKQYLTLVYQIHSEGQYKALLSAAEWVDASDSHAIAERYDLQTELADTQAQRQSALRAIEQLNDELGKVSDQRDELKQALQYAVNQVPELITVPGIRATITKAGAAT